MTREADYVRFWPIALFFTVFFASGTLGAAIALHAIYGNGWGWTALVILVVVQAFGWGMYKNGRDDEENK